MPIAARFMDTVAGPVDCPRHTSYCAVAAMKERLAVTRTSHMRPHGASAELRPPRRASALLRALLEQRHRIGRIAAGPGLRAHLDRNRQRVAPGVGRVPPRGVVFGQSRRHNGQHGATRPSASTAEHCLGQLQIPDSISVFAAQNRVAQGPGSNKNSV